MQRILEQASVTPILVGLAGLLQSVGGLAGFWVVWMVFGWFRILAITEQGMRSMTPTGLVSVYSSHDHGDIVKSRLESGTYSSNHLSCLLLFRPLCELRVSEWRSLLAVFIKTIVTSKH